MFEKALPAGAWVMLTVMLLTPVANDLALAQSLSTPADASGPGSPTPARDEATYSPPPEVKTPAPHTREAEARDGMPSRYTGMMLKGSDLFMTTATAPPPTLALAAMPSGPVSRDSTFHRSGGRSAEERARDRVWMIVAGVGITLAVLAALGIRSALQHASTL